MTCGPHSRRARCVATAVVIGCALALASGAGARAVEGRPVALAASSLARVLPSIYPDARVSAAGSNRLAQQIRFGARFDVFLSASPVYTQRLFRETLVRKPVPFATNELVLIVPRSNPAGIESVRDLLTARDVRLVAASPQVPIGAYTEQVLQRLGMRSVLARAVSLEPDVSAISAKIGLAQGDAAFVYATDARALGDRVTVVRLPARAQPRVVLELAIATVPQDLAAAERLVAAILSARGRRVLRAAGFGVM